MSSSLMWCWADARPGAGLGHVVRSAALAQAWIDAGGAALLCTSSDDRRVIGTVTAADVRHERLDERDEPRTLEGARRFAERARDAGAAWVTIDGYGLDAKVDSTVREFVSRVARIDDHVAGRDYDADVVVDQNLGAETSGPAMGGGETLAGTRFALLRRAFRPRTTRSEGPPHLLVTLGGCPSDSTIAFAGTVLDQLEVELSIDVVSARPVPTGRAHRWHDWVPDIAALCNDATVALTPAGSTVWELCAKQVCPVVFSVADNQHPVGAALAAAEAATYLGPLSRIDASAAVQAIGAIVHDRVRREQMRARVQLLVDGLGAPRVAARLRADLLDLRPVVLDDARLLFEWANDPIVRARSFATAPIGWDEHLAWLGRRLANDRAATYIATDGTTPVGMVRFDELDRESVEIGVSVAAAHRGQKLGAPIIVAGCRRIVESRVVEKVQARIRADNGPSLRAFSVAGFDQVGVDAADGYVVERWQWMKPW